MVKFKKFLKKEIFNYLIILLILTLIMHIDIVSDPLTRLQNMQEQGNYFHPLLYTFVVYIIILIIRKIIDFFVSIFEKKND